MRSLDTTTNMAAKALDMDRETFFCSICLDLLKEPVTIPCGHSYCMSCVNTHWNEESWKQTYSCPQCRQNFTPRPVLAKNAMLSVLMERLKKTVAPADHVYAAHGDVACNRCSGRKLKAVKSCCDCRMSFCKDHLQPHYDRDLYKCHKLMEPIENIQEICRRHSEVMKMFCRTDQQCICYLCSVEECKGHDIVTAEAERAERQPKIAVRQQKIRQRFEEKQKLVETLKKEVDIMTRSANTTIEESQDIFTEMNNSVEMKRVEVKWQIKSIQETEKERVKELQDQLEQEISTLKRKHSELEKLSQTSDHYHFINYFKSLSKLDEDSEDDSAVIKKGQMPFFGHVLTTGLTALKDISVSVFRDQLLHYACDVTLNLNTLHNSYTLSAGNRKLRSRPSKIKRRYRRHPERFSHHRQVLSREPLTGRCYVELNANYTHTRVRLQTFTVALAYKDIPRKGSSVRCKFGRNENSWALICYSNDEFLFSHNNRCEDVLTDCALKRVGIYLDHDAGILAFYRLNEPQNLIHEVRTTFTQPLYLGLSFDGKIDSLEVCKLK